MTLPMVGSVDPAKRDVAQVRVRPHLQRVLFVLCASASAALLWPTWKETSYYLSQGDPFVGGERIFVVTMMSIPLLGPVIVVSLIGCFVLTAGLWNKVPGVRSRATIWFILFLLGTIRWPTIGPLEENPKLFGDIVDLVLLSASLMTALTWLIFPPPRVAG